MRDGTNQGFRHGLVDFWPGFAISAGMEDRNFFPNQREELPHPQHGGVASTCGSGAKHLRKKSPKCDGGRKHVIFIFGKMTIGVVERFLNVSLGEDVGQGQPRMALPIKFFDKKPVGGVLREYDPGVLVLFFCRPGLKY